MTVKFVKGPASKYTGSYLNDGCVYFATDTQVIYMGGNSYGISTSDLAKLQETINSITVTANNELYITYTSGDNPSTILLKPVSSTYNGLMTPTQKANLEGALEDIEALEESVAMNKVASTDKTITVTPGTSSGGSITPTNLAVNIDGTTIVKGTDGKLSVASASISVEGDDAIVVTSSETGKTVTLKIADTEKVLSQDEDGLKTTISIKSVTPSGSNVKEEYALVGIDGQTTLGQTIKVYKDSSLANVELEGQKLKFTYNLADGTTKVEEVDISLFLAESEFKNGLEVSEDGEVSILIATDSEKYLTVGEAGLKVSGIDAAIKTEKDRAESAEADLQDAIDDLTASDITATVIGNGTATDVQGVLKELYDMWEWHEA